MKYLSTTNLQRKKITAVKLITLLAATLMLAFTGTAQERLVGLTSNGGVEGRGTAFSIKTNGDYFKVFYGFADWGRSGNGNLYKDADGNFYGLTSTGGTYNSGTVFRMTSTGAVTVLRHLNSVADGASPFGELIKGTDGSLYGTNSIGGTNGYGTIFKITTAGTYTVLKHLAYTEGTNPKGHLAIAPDGNYYGITYGGGNNGAGTIFKLTPAGAFTVIKHLNKTTDGGNSYGGLTTGSDGLLYGITYSGGTNNLGTIFKINTTGTLTVIHHFSGTADGAGSLSDLIQAQDGSFYGTCYSGGTYGNGTIFKITSAGSYSVLKHLLSSVDGGNPYGNLFQDTNGMLYGMNRIGGSQQGGTAFRVSVGGSYKVLHAFVNATEGSTPVAGFVKYTDGLLYALTSEGGYLGGGTAFKMDTTGSVTVVANFNGAAAGNAPFETMIKGSDSAYYGTTSGGGAYGFGSIFKICGGVTTTLHSFNKNTEGGTPKGSLLLAKDGLLYGTTTEGGSNGYGTIFKITLAGNYSVLRQLNPATDGGAPQAALTQGTDSLLYGTTSNGGASNGGTIFKISTAGTFTVLRHLKYDTDGSNPEGNLVQGTDGNFYGLTSVNAHFFKVSSNGTFTLLHTFISSSEGNTPLGGLILHTDGNFYATNSSAGLYGYGTIVKITPAGTVTVIKQLNPIPDGRTPKGNLLATTDGNMYGLTSAGGTNNLGTIFKITPAGNYTVLHHFDMAADGGNPFGGLVLAPVNNLVANAQSITINEDTKKAVTLSGTGGNNLVYTIVTPPAKGKLTGTGANRTYAPNKNFSGKDSFAFTVSVGCLTSPPAFVSFTIKAVADTPVLAPIGNKTATKNSPLTFTAVATDPDKGQTITYTLIGAPTGATINATTGVFAWTPTKTGSFTFTVRATDNSKEVLYDEEQITVTVNAAFAKTMEDEKMQKKINAVVYPNPVDDKFFISIDKPVDEMVVDIIDMNGKILSSNVYQASGRNAITVDATSLAPGYYIVRILTAMNNTASARIIKR